MFPPHILLLGFHRVLRILYMYASLKEKLFDNMSYIFISLQMVLGSMESEDTQQSVKCQVIQISIFKTSLISGTPRKCC